MQYTPGFKESMVQKLAMPGGPSATQLAREVGVSQSTLSRWLRQASRLEDHPEPVTPILMRKSMPAKRPQDWTPEQKWEALIEASRLPEDQRGAFLRRRGLHQAHLDRWREDVMAGLNRSVRRSAGRPEARRVRQLERELARKEKALAEAAALLVLKKKSSRSGGTRTQT